MSEAEIAHDYGEEGVNWGSEPAAVGPESNEAATETPEALARRYGWASFEDTDNKDLLVVANDQRSVHFTGPDAWSQALAYDKEVGHILTDQQALDAITRAMSGAEWDADLWDVIARSVRATGRVISDVDELDEDGEAEED